MAEVASSCSSTSRSSSVSRCSSSDGPGGLDFLVLVFSVVIDERGGIGERSSHDDDDDDDD